MRRASAFIARRRSWASMSTMSREKFSLTTIRKTVMCSAFGGSVAAGPREVGGWGVRAVLEVPGHRDQTAIPG